MVRFNPFTGKPMDELPEDENATPAEKVITAAMNEMNIAAATIKAEEEEKLSESDSALQELGELIAAREAALAEIKDLGPKFEKEDEEDAKLLEELAKKQQEIMRRKREREREKSLKRQEWQRLQQEITDKKRLQTEMLHKKEMELKYKLEYDSYLNKVPENTKWRTHAYAHQIDGAIRLAMAKRAICGDKPGLGKTLQSIMYMDFVEAKRVLVVAPADTLSNYAKELANWAPQRVVRIMGGMPKLQRDMWFLAFQGLKQFVLIINYEAWRRDYNDIITSIKQLQLDTVIFDEAHLMAEGKTLAFKGASDIVYAENVCQLCEGYTEVKKTKGIAGTVLQCTVCQNIEYNVGAAGKVGAARRSVKNVLPMTGTSIKAKPQNIWTLLNLMNREEFPDLQSYLDRFCIMTYEWRKSLTDHGVEEKRVGVWRFAPGGQDRLIKRIGTHRIVSRTPESAGVKMPEQDIRHHWLTFDGQYKKQREVMNWIRKYFIKTGEEKGVQFDHAITRLLRMRQAMTWPGGIKVRNSETKEVIWQADANESIILDKAMQITQDAVDAENRVLIFSQFKEPLVEMQRRLEEEGITVCRYDGDTPEDVRQKIKDDVDSKLAEKNPNILQPQSEENPNGFKYWVVLANYKTGGTGLNIDLCREIVFLDREWTPAGEDQAMARTARVNTKWSSIVHMLHVENTITDVMDAIMELKREIVDGYEQEIDMVEMLNKALNQEY